ncbi:MAG TPA: TonB-dependent receptor [Candidatus Krumholzibacteria bacterium]|nr:TonB-dependent receptor [Candidatus Krumholzibacteria bacterium]
MPPILIEADRPDRRAELTDRSGFVTTVDLTARRGRVEDLAALLSQLVGVRVTQYGGLGSFATVSIRGSSSSQVRTFLDGMPMDDPYLGVTNLGDLPLGGVGRVEVYRGFSPAQLGGSAIGGAVHLVTREDGTRPGPLTGLEGNLSGGSFGTQRENGSLWLKRGLLRFFAHGTHERSAGDYTFHDDNGTPFNPDDDETATRVNNDFDAWNAMARVSADAPGVADVSLAYHDASRENGVPGLGSFQSTAARSERRRRIGQLRFDGAPVANRQIHWWADGFYQRTNDRFTDRESDLALIPTDTDNEVAMYGGSTRAKWYMSWLPVALEGTFTGTKEQYHPVSHLPQRSEGPDRWRRSSTASIGADVYLLDQKLVLTSLYRVEHYENEFYDPPRFPWLPPTPQGRVTHEGETPSVGALWQATSWLAVKGNAGRYYRVPTFLELFGNTGSVTGNATLEPEKGENLDAGIVISATRTGALRAVLFEVSYFDNTAENLILFFPNSQYTSKPDNIGSARIRGWELSVAASLLQRLELSAAYTRMDSEDTSDIPYYRGNDLPSRPRDDASVSLAGLAGPLRLTYELHHIGPNWLDRANLRAAPSRTLHGALLSVRTPVDGLTFALEGRNLGNDQAVDVAGYPLPGRSIYSTLSYRYE